MPQQQPFADVVAVLIRSIHQNLCLAKGVEVGDLCVGQLRADYSVGLVGVVRQGVVIALSAQGYFVERASPQPVTSCRLP